MIPLAIAEVAKLAPGRLVQGAGTITEIGGVTIDSRRTRPGDLFVAIGGGSEFVEDALGHGAAAALVPDDGHAALAALGRAIRERSEARFVAITGSMGKTTTKDILAALCRPQRRTVAAERSYNAEIGVPLTLCRLEAETEICILELAMRGFGQITALCEIAQPDIGVITNVGPVHLAQVGSQEGVVLAKTELLTALPAGGTAVVPAGFPVVRDDLEVVRVGEDVRLESFEPPRLVTSLGALEVDFTARHLAANALTAIATAHALGLDLPERLKVEFAEWRNQELPLAGGGMLINDAWNANPVSMRAALEHLCEQAEGRRTVAVLGEMAELGAYSREGHDEVGRAVEEAGVDVVVAVGEAARAYGGTWVPTTDDAVSLAAELVRPGDCVLVKGARVMALERVADALLQR